MTTEPPTSASPRERRRAQAAAAAPVLTWPQFMRAMGAALLFAVAYWLFAAVPLTVPLGDHYSLNLRPGVLVPLLAGLLGGPVVGVLTGVVGRVAGELLVGGGLSLAGPIYAGLLGLVAGLGIRPDSDGRTLATQARCALWVVIANAAAALGATLLVQTLVLRQAALPAGWDQTVSDFMSGLVSALLLLPGAVFLFFRPTRRPRR